MPAGHCPRKMKLAHLKMVSMPQSPHGVFITARDVAWGISTSGSSPNVVSALKAARARCMHTAALTGQSGGDARDACDVLMAVPLTSTPRVQEVHTITYHIICAAVEESIFG